jgi:hypothetical protein
MIISLVAHTAYHLSLNNNALWLFLVGTSCCDEDTQGEEVKAINHN